MKSNWFNADGEKISFNDILIHAKKYVDAGKNIFIGSDSMLYTKNCVFVTSICLHDDKNKRSNYFYRREKIQISNYNDLKTRIFKEVEDAIDVGFVLMESFSKTCIEIHIDIGKESRSKTNKFVDVITGWIKSLGFGVKLKPKSWAASSVADWHTKRIKRKKECK